MYGKIMKLNFRLGFEGLKTKYEDHKTETWVKPCQISMMESFAKMVNG